MYKFRQLDKPLVTEQSVSCFVSALCLHQLFPSSSTQLRCHCIESNPVGLISHHQNHNYIYFPSTRAHNWGTLTPGNLSSEKSIV